MRMASSNQNNDNAFLMKIGDYVFIEFGKQNNACHVFRADNKPFTTGQTSVSGTTTGLKNTFHPGHRKKLTHHDGWQSEFAHFLRSYANAMPVVSKPKAVAFHALDTTKITASHQTATVVKSSNQLVSTQNQQKAIVDIKQLPAFCAAHNLPIVDLRLHGAALWVRATNTDKVISDALESMGFRYKEGKGWWRE